MVLMTKQEIKSELENKGITHEINANGQILIRLSRRLTQATDLIGIVEEMKTQWVIKINSFSVYFHSLRFHGYGEFDLYFNDEAIFEGRF